MLNMDKLVARVRANRGEDCIDVNGVCRATPEAAQWKNDVHAWKLRGRPESEKADLDRRHAEMRAQGVNV